MTPKLSRRDTAIGIALVLVIFSAIYFGIYLPGGSHSLPPMPQVLDRKIGMEKIDDLVLVDLSLLEDAHYWPPASTRNIFMYGVSRRDKDELSRLERLRELLTELGG